MNKFKNIIIPTLLFVLSFSVSLAVTKPDPAQDLSSLSYVFYLYYDNGQLFGDRDYPVKYDILNETFVLQVVAPGFYKLEILNSNSEVVETIQFDPRQGNPSFTVGKAQIKAPYVANGQRAVFYNDQGTQLVNLFIFEGALCNDDGSCSLGQGENENTCPSDCVKKTTTPLPVSPIPLEEGFDMLNIITYVVGGLLVAVGAWFGWKWWQKKKEESFLPPPASPPAPPALPTQGSTPLPPSPLSGENLLPLR